MFRLFRLQHKVQRECGPGGISHQMQGRVTGGVPEMTHSKTHGGGHVAPVYRGHPRGRGAVARKTQPQHFIAGLVQRRAQGTQAVGRVGHTMEQ